MMNELVDMSEAVDASEGTTGGERAAAVSAAKRGLTALQFGETDGDAGDADDRSQFADVEAS
jgi:hypothetical protein